MPARGIDLEVGQGEILGIAGESGCGKTLLLRTIMRLMPPGMRVEAGSILFGQDDLLTMPARRLRSILGRRIAMVFQEPLAALNPVFTVGAQLVEAIRQHQNESRATARAYAVKLLQELSVPQARQRLGQYPHQLSGGMRQRVILAIALCARPCIILADEPTSSLDVTVQSQVLALLASLRERYGLSVVLVSHDLTLLSQVCDRIAIMYLGRIVEVGKTEQIVKETAHPYTKALLDCIPKPVRPKNGQTSTAPTRLTEVPGELPTATSVISGCQFRTRCPKARPECGLRSPPLHPLSDSHSVACFMPN